MAAQPSTTGSAEISEWGDLVKAGLERRQMSQAELVRRLNRTNADKSIVSKWVSKKGSPPVADVAAHVARILDIPPSIALRAAGHHTLAEAFEEVASGAATGAAALEPQIAQVRELLRDLDPAQREQAIRRYLDRAADSLTLVKVEATQSRQEAREGAGGDDDDDDDDGGARNAV